MSEWKAEGNKIVVNGKEVEFKYPIEETKEYKNSLIVSLEYTENDGVALVTNAVYAVSQKGDILWQMQDVKEFDTTMELAPIVGVNVNGNQIIAVDYFSRKYYLNPENGEIERMEKGSW